MYCFFKKSKIFFKLWFIAFFGFENEPLGSKSSTAWGQNNLHLTKMHEVARKKRVMLKVGDLSLKEHEFLELSLERYSVNIGGYPFTYVCCAFCGKKFQLDREILKHLNLTNWRNMLQFIQKRSYIIVKSVSASLG